jgi:hypothetical protein
MTQQTTHLTTSQLERIRTGNATGAEVLAFSQHIAECVGCAARAEERIVVPASVDAVRAAFTETDARPRRSQPSAVWLAAVAVAAIAVTAVLLREPPAPAPVVARNAPPSAPVIRTTPPAPATSAPSRPEWNALIAEVRRSGKLPLPADIREFATGDTFRGATTSAAAAVTVSPMATAVEEERPLFRWPATSGARYTVSVVADGEVVAKSPVLRSSPWRSNVPLERGRVYSWQVRAEHGDAISVLPAPPNPPALFRIVSAQELAELERARQERPDDHLLLALLSARAGIIEAARRELERSDDPLAGTLLGEL